MGLTKLTDVQLAEESLRAVRGYPAKKAECQSIDAEMRARGPERMLVALAEICERREAARLAAQGDKS